MIVAVTGANGFIGSHLCPTLRGAGHDVRPILRSDFNTSAVASRLRGVDALVHAAGATRARTESALRAANVDLTRDVLHLARTAGVRRFVLISSQAAAGPATNRDTPRTETDEPCPVEAYGRSKLEAEAIVRGGGVPFVILRPAAVYGPGDRDFLTVFRLAARGFAIHPSNRDHWISIVHVGDLASTVVRAIETPTRGRTYFVANADPLRWRDVFELAARACDRTSLLHLEVPYAIARLGALVGDTFARIHTRPPLLSSGKLALSRPHYWICSNHAAVRDLGFTQTTSVAEGFRHTRGWYQTARWLR